MCTAISFKQRSRFLLRTLDAENRYRETVSVTPRGFPFDLRHEGIFRTKYAFVGTAYIKDGYPLYYDGANECGVAAAALNFVGNAKYFERKGDRLNLAHFEIIPYVLGSASSIKEARALLENINVTKDAFSEDLPPSELHFFVTDGETALAVEQTEDGMKVYDDEAGVLTNNPPFPFHRENLRSYISLSASDRISDFAASAKLSAFSSGCGALGLPGDFSSPSRFVRAAFVRFTADKKDEKSELSQAFRVIESVFVPEGCVLTERGKNKTQYTAAVNLDSRTYFFKTYEGSRIGALRLDEALMSSKELTSVDMSFSAGAAFPKEKECPY